MSPLTEPTTLVLAKDYTRPDDPDAVAYIAAVEAADTAAGQTGGLETATKMAINAFVKGCKADGIWPALKASCILAGARTLNGALVPLVGTAPTNNNFVSGDYNRKTGLVGDGTTKSLNSGLSYTAISTQGIVHKSVYVSTASSNAYLSVNAENQLANAVAAIRNSSVSYAGSTVGFIGISLPSALIAAVRANGATVNAGSAASNAASSRPIGVFCRDGLTPSARSACRLAFYSIGESLDLAKLDSRVTDLINAIGAAF